MKQKFLLFMLVGLWFPIMALSAVKKSGYVGDYIDLELSKSYSELSQSPGWREYSGPVECVTLTAVGYTNRATVRIDKYFTGTVVISCTYNTKSNMPGTESFEITCNPVYLNPSSTSMSLEVGDKEYITYTTSPSNHRPTLSFSSSNESVASVDAVDDYTGLVTAHTKGTATITLNNSEGPDATIKVNVGSGGGGGGGDDPDPNPDPSLKVGDWFYEKTKEGYDMQFCVEQINGEICCAVIPRSTYEPTIRKSATGTITIPRTAKGFIVRAIDNSAFSNCSQITSIVIPNSVNSIQSFAFDGCTSLSSVTSQNETPPNMGSSVFPSSVYNNATLYVPKGCKSKYKSATGWTYFKKIEEIGGSEPDIVEPTSITVSPSSKTINVNETFYASYTLTPSNAETSVTWYSDDSSIATVTSSGLVKGIKAGTTYINAKTSNGKEDWCKVTVTSSSPVVPTSITVSPSSKTINVNETFYASYTLTPSDAETSVTWYSDDSSIATVTSSGLVKGIKAGTTYINAKTSNGKEDWCKVTVTADDNGYKDGDIIEYNVNGWSMQFQVISAKDKTCQVGRGINHIDGTTIYFYPAISVYADNEITIPSNVEGFDVVKINDGAFINREAMLSLTIPNSVTEIGMFAFQNCCSLTSLTIPNSVKSIGKYSISKCTNLTSVVLPENLGEIEDGMFWADSTLMTVKMPSKMTSYIGESAFQGCEKLTEIIIPNGVKTIGNSSFYMCVDLNKITIPETVETIEEYAFLWCYKLKEIHISNINVWCKIDFESTSSNPFYSGDGFLYLNGKKMDELLIPKDIAEIKNYSFYSYSSSLNNIYSHIENPFTINTETFTENTYNSSILYVPFGTKVRYLSTEGWKKFKNIVEMENPKISITLSEVGFATFYDSQSAYSLPSGLVWGIVNGVSNNNVSYNWSSSNIIPKGIPVIIKSTTNQGGVFTLTSTEDVTAHIDNNLLRGSDEMTIATPNDYEYVYKLCYGPSGSAMSNVFGWYWGAANGEKFQIEGHRAWLAVSKSVTSQHLLIDKELIDIKAIVKDEYGNDENFLYDIRGVRLTKPLKNGLYIQNGKKMFVK